MNSNTFSDAPGQEHSYKYGSLSHADAGTRRQAIEHNIECIEIGRTIGSKALTVWIGDGSNFPGPVNFTKASSAISTSMRDDLQCAAGGLAHVLRAQDVRAGLLLDRRAGLGHQLHRSPRSSGRRPIAWSTSATMRRTSTSR